MWALLASYMFYATGHHATLGHLRWAPAFHAGDPTYLGPWGHYISGAMVSLELFGEFWEGLFAVERLRAIYLVPSYLCEAMLLIFIR